MSDNKPAPAPDGEGEGAEDDGMGDRFHHMRDEAKRGVWSAPAPEGEGEPLDEWTFPDEWDSAPAPSPQEGGELKCDGCGNNGAVSSGVLWGDGVFVCGECAPDPSHQEAEPVGELTPMGPIWDDGLPVGTKFYLSPPTDKLRLAVEGVVEEAEATGYVGEHAVDGGDTAMLWAFVDLVKARMSGDEHEAD